MWELILGWLVYLIVCDDVEVFDSWLIGMVSIWVGGWMFVMFVVGGLENGEYLCMCVVLMFFV